MSNAGEYKSVINTKLFDNPISQLLDKLNNEKKKLIERKEIIDKKTTFEIVEKKAIFEIPENWIWVNLSDISIIQEGPGIRKFQYTKEGIQFLTVTNILDGRVDLDKSEKYISLNEFKTKYTHFRINKGDIVTACSGGSWGKSAIYDLDNVVILNTSTLRLRFYGDLGDNYYLYYLTKAEFFKSQLENQLSGQQPNFGYSHYSKIKIPLPVLSEQKRIVSILDKIYSIIDEARVYIERNLKNTKDLFENYIQNVFTKGGDDWVERRLGDVCDKITQGPNPQYDSAGNEYFRVIKTKDLYDHAIHYELSDRISKEVFNSCSSSELMNGDVLLAIVGQGSINKCNVFENKTPYKYIFTRAIGLLRTKKTELNPNYLAFFLRSRYGKKLVDAGIFGTSGQQVVTTTHIKGIKIPIPSLDIQIRLVRKFEELLTESKKLEANYSKKIERLNELKKSILQQAFAGKLTHLEEMITE
jgi:type I restriction enzyme, S subunit